MGKTFATWFDMLTMSGAVAPIILSLSKDGAKASQRLLRIGSGISAAGISRTSSSKSHSLA